MGRYRRKQEAAHRHVGRTQCRGRVHRRRRHRDRRSERRCTSRCAGGARRRSDSGSDRCAPVRRGRRAASPRAGAVAARPPVSRHRVSATRAVSPAAWRDDRLSLRNVTARELIDAVHGGCVGLHRLRVLLRCGMGPWGRARAESAALPSPNSSRARCVHRSTVGRFRARFPAKPLTLGQLAMLPNSAADRFAPAPLRESD